MNATKRAQVPFGLRKKLMAATSMLLVAAIMLVSTSYAWFTLSTAPEITGITTSVGANGNLEIALLTTDTFANPDLITSGTQDSMEAAGGTAAKANVTWGNLVDLSEGYGLDKITLYPAKLNLGAANTLAGAPLGTPEYGSDGRVKVVTGNTISAIYKDSTFADSGEQTYGVRAVGTSSNVSARAITLKSAKSTYNSKVSAIPTPIRNAVNSNIMPFLTLAVTGGAPDEYTYDQVAAMKDIATGVRDSLNNIVVAYANAGLAKAAADASITDDGIVAALELAIANKTSAAELQTLMNATENGAVTDYNAQLTELATLQGKVDTVLTGLDGLLKDDSGAPVANTTVFKEDDEKQVVSTAVSELLGAGLPLEDATGASITSKEAMSKPSLYLVGGVVNEVAKYAGTFHLTTQVEKAVYAGSTKYPETPEADKRMNPELLKSLTAAGATNATANITDFYGYIIDFAFRTNAAESKLQLQTAAENRVYSSANDPTLATMGNGSTVTFTYNTDSGLSSAQAAELLNAVRIVFFNPDNSEIYTTAKITNVDAGNTSATGEIYLIAEEEIAYELGKEAFVPATYTAKDTYNNTNTQSYQATLTAAQYEALAADNTTGTGATDNQYVLGKDAYEISEYAIKTGDALKYGDTVITTDLCTNYVTDTISVATYETLKSKTTQTTSTTLAADKSEITALSQNVVQKVSALVYLDGENIDNSAVAAKAASSGDLKLNLQFSSSAELVPMENNTLKNMEKPNP